jgi:cell division initiation protein
MRITPLDVRKQEFRRGMRGLDPDEVYAFLATVADEYEAALNDNKALRERLLELDDKVQEYRAIERTLRDTLVTAERVTVESKDNARREATLIIKEAQLQAERALRDISSEAVRLRQEVQRLRSQRDAYIAKMRVVAESHVKFLESAERDFHADDTDLPADLAAPAAPAPAAAPSSVEERPRPANLFEALASASPIAPAAPASRPPAGPAAPQPPTEVLPGISDILERLTQSQREAMAPAPPRREPVTPPPPAPAAPETAPAAEWNMDQFRRDLQNIVGTPHEGPPR